MNCIIVVNAYIKNTSQLLQAQRLSEELRAFGVENQIVKNISLADIEKGDVKTINADFCIYLDKDKAAARLLEKGGLKLFNSAKAIEICDDKMLTHIALSNVRINMPTCVYAPLCYYPDAQISNEFIDDVAKKLGFPLVAKLCYGSLGAGVKLINNMEELREYENTNKLSAHFYQQFIGKGGEDIRVLVIGGKYVCSMLRKNDNDFRSNIELGGRGENYKADSGLIKLCERVAKILELDYCGIDVLTDIEGNRYICEVNSNAFFKEAERVCEINIAKKYVEHIIAIKNA